MKTTNSILLLILVAIFMAASSSWQTVGARVRLVSSPNSNNSSSSGKVMKQKPPQTGQDPSEDPGEQQREYYYGCGWEETNYKPHTFSVAADKQVVFTAGNLIYEAELKYKRSQSIGSEPGILMPYATHKWFVAEHQWESLYNLSDIYYLQKDENGCITLGTRGETNRPVSILMKEYLMYEDKFSYDREDFTFKTEEDWATIMPTNGQKRYTLLTPEEWDYLLNQRENAASLREVGKINSLIEDSKVVAEEGLILYPDGYTGPKAGSTVVDKDKWIMMEKAGAIFLPTTNRETLGLFSYESGYYMTTSPNSVLYFDMRGSVKIEDVDPKYKYDSCVRLVYYYEQGCGTEAYPFKISTGADLSAFRDAVNEGHADLCGELVSNVSLDQYDDWEPIGRYGYKDERPYTGKFVGNGHKIYDIKQKTFRGDDYVTYSGLFGYVGDGAEISDFELMGDIVISDEQAVFVFGASPVIGIVSMITDEGVIHKGVSVSEILCTCKYTLNLPQAFTINAGGVVGAVMGDSQNEELLQVSQSWFITGSIDIATNNSIKPRLGGIIGYGPTEGRVSITDCGSYSPLTFNKEKSGCGILGYLDCNSRNLTASIRNCYAHSGGEYAIAYLYNADGDATVTMSNNYYRLSFYGEGMAVDSKINFPDAAIGQTQGDVMTGITTFLLNKQVSGGGPWHQKIGVFPVLQKTEELIYATDNPNVFTNTDPSALTTAIAQPSLRDGEVVYYDLLGRRIESKSGVKGVNIVVEKLSDGTVRRSKIVKK